MHAVRGPSVILSELQSTDKEYAVTYVLEPPKGDTTGNGARGETDQGGDALGSAKH